MPRRQKRDGKNLQLTRRKAASNTLPRHIADTARQLPRRRCRRQKHTLYTPKPPPPPFSRKTKTEKKNRKNLVP